MKFNEHKMCTKFGEGKTAEEQCYKCSTSKKSLWLKGGKVEQDLLAETDRPHFQKKHGYSVLKSIP